MKSNTETILKLFLKTINANVNSQTASKCLERHPNYNSLLAISDCLNEWDISNRAVKIDKSGFSDDDLTYPFIAYLGDKNGSFILVKRISGTTVNYFDENGKNASIDRDHFFLMWDGILLEAEVNSYGKEKNYRINRIRYLLENLRPSIGIGIFVILLIFIIKSQNLSFIFISFILLKVTGVIVTSLLLVQSIDAKNPLVKNICGLIGKNDCNSILKSEAANITDWLSWSDVGFVYFTGSLL